MAGPPRRRERLPRRLRPLLIGLLAFSLIAGVPASSAHPLTSSAPPANGSARGDVLASTTSPSAIGAWTNITSSSGAPPTRCCAMMTYDPRDGYILLFGGGGGPSCLDGCNDTWAYRAGHWFPIATSISPPARAWGAMAFDPFDGYVLLFGGLSLTTGQALSDAWAYSNGRWTLLSSTAPPAARWGAGLAPDLTDGTMVLFGGYSSAQGFFGDTWTFQGGTWTELAPPTSPSPRWTPGMTFDPELGGVLLFGGFGTPSGFLSDTWVFDEGTWHPIATAVAPPAREKAVMDYDVADQAVLLFGGDVCPVGCGPGRPTRLLNDTWTFADGTWTNRTAAGGPPPQCCAAMAYNGAGGGEVLLASNGSVGGASISWEIAFAPPPVGHPEILDFLAFPSVPTTDNVTSVLVEARPASGNLTYQYSGLPAGCVGSDYAVWSCRVLRPGNYTLNVTVGDATGVNVSGTLELEVLAAPTASGTPAVSGGSLRDTEVVGGGVLAAVVALVLFYRWATRRRRPPVPTDPGPRPQPQAVSDAKR